MQIRTFGQCCFCGRKQCGHHRLEHGHLVLHKLHLIVGLFLISRHLFFHESDQGLVLAVLTLCTSFMTRARSSLPRVRKSDLVTPLAKLWDNVLDLALEVIDLVVSLSDLSVSR